MKHTPRAIWTLPYLDRHQRPVGAWQRQRNQKADDIPFHQSPCAMMVMTTSTLWRLGGGHEVGIDVREAKKLILVDGCDGVGVRRCQCRMFVGEVHVKVGSVSLVATVGDVGRLDVAPLQPLPVDGAEEGVGLDRGAASWCAAESLVYRSRQEAAQDAHGTLTDPGRVDDLLMENVVEELVVVIALERRLSRQHLVHQDAQRPPVNRAIVHALLDDLWRDVVGGPAERACRCAVHDALLAHSKVCDLDVALRAEHDVVQLQVAVDDAGVVQVQERADDFAGVEAGARLVEAVRALHVEHQVSTVDVLHDVK